MGGRLYSSFTIYIKSHVKWHILGNDTQACRDHFPESPFVTMGVTDGGLVCWIERFRNSKENSLSIMVCNPLTGAFRKLQLPNGALGSAQPSMVKLVMDDDSKAYKVVAVGPTGNGGVVYHSASDTWTSTEFWPGFEFEEEYECGDEDWDEDDDR